MNSILPRVRAMGLFIGAVWASMIIINFIVRGFTAHHADNPAAQGLANVT